MTPDDLDMADAPTTPEEWATATVITDDETLTRILRWARATQRQRDAVRGIVQPELDRLEAWAAEMDTPLRERFESLKRAAEMYVLDKRAHTEGRVKSVKTPHGVVKTSESGGGWEVADEAALLAWARKAHPEFVKIPVVVESFDLAGSKRVLKALDKTNGGEVMDPVTSEIVPGLKTKPTTVGASVSLEVAP